MKLSKIIISGFRGVKKVLEINLPSGFIVICGRNGSGKSTICNAIEFALTGQLQEYNTHSERSESIKDYIWWRGSEPPKESFVKLEISNGLADPFTIERNYLGSSSKVEKDLINYLVDTNISPLDPLKQLCQTTILRDEQITDLSINLPETERFKLAQIAIGGNKLQTITSRIEALYKSLRERHNLKKSEYEKLRERISDMTARLSEARVRTITSEEVTNSKMQIRDILKLNSDNDKELVTASNDNLLKSRLRINLIRESLSALQDMEIRTKEINSKSYIDKYKLIENEYKNGQSELNKIKEDFINLETKIAKFDTLEPYQKALVELLTSGKYIGIENDKCPLCGSTITKEKFFEHINEIEASIETEKKALIKLIENRTQLSGLIREKELHINQLGTQLSHLKTTEESLLLSIADAAFKGTSLGIKFSNNISDNIELLKKELQLTYDSISELEKATIILEYSSEQESILLLERQLRTYKDELLILDSDLRKIEDVDNKIKSSLDTIKRVSGEVVDEHLSLISPILNELYFRFKPHSDWQNINYNLRGDVRRFLSLSVGENLNPNFIFSSGQRRAVGISFLLAIHLTRQWCNLKTLILDDPVQHIDDFRALHLTEVLSAIRKTGRQIICTVEDEDLALLLCRRLRSSFNDEGLLVNMSYKPGVGVEILSQQRIIPLKERILKAS